MTEQELIKKKLEATKKWMTEFNYIPTEAIRQLSRVEEVERMTETEPTEDFLPMWGTMFSFKESLDEEWADQNVAIFDEVGISLYNVPSIGTVMGIDGAGYDFYESHWLPLYEKRGFKWHEFL